jgi:hypothetical protein
MQGCDACLDPMDAFMRGLKQALVSSQYKCQLLCFALEDDLVADQSFFGLVLA